MRVAKSWRRRASIASVFLLLAGVLIGGGSPAAAAGPSDCGPGETWREFQGCVERRSDAYGGVLPGGGDATTIPVIEARGGEPPRCFQDAGGERREVECVTANGWWNGTCYVKQVTDPPAGRAADFEEAMADHEGGAVISCYYPLCDTPDEWRNDVDADLLQCPVYNWAPDAEPIDPAAVAEEIWARLTKRGIDIGVAPYDEPDHMGYVGVGTWYWVEDPEPETIGPLGDSDSSRGFTVVAESQVDHIEWDLGNGEELECPPDSMPFEEGKNLGHRYPEGSPDCGYVFTEMGVYDIAARVHWTESWTGLGQVGSREFTLESDTTIRIGENQVLRQ